MSSLNLLDEILKEMGFEANKETLENLLTYKKLLVEWNEKMNLTGITQEKEVFTKHFADCLACFLPEKIENGAKVIDVGTGAGFPGLVLKIYNKSLNMTLLDSLNKRINFLKEVSKDCNLENINFIHGRAEDFGRDKNHREQYDVAVSRAVAPLNVLLEYLTPFVKEGGYIICQKGPSLDEELINAKKAIEVFNLKIEKKMSYDILYEELNHNLIVFTKKKKTPAKYPRKAGMPSKSPIV